MVVLLLLSVAVVLYMSLLLDVLLRLLDVGVVV